MPLINVQPKQMQNGDNVTSFSDTVGTENTTFTFLQSQETVILRNKGTKSITYNLGGQSGSLGRSESVKVTGSVTEFTLSSEQGTQAFEIWAEEVGSLLPTGGNDPRVDSLVSQLAQKANQTDLNAKRDKSTLITLADLTQDVRTSMTGGSVAVVGKNAILPENVTKRAIKQYHTSFITVGKNLFNQNAVTDGSWVNNGGVLTANASYCYSDFIPAEPNTAYYVANTYSIAEYDAIGTFIKVQWINNITFTTASNTAFIVISCTISGKAATQLELGTAFTGYESFGYKVNLPLNKAISLSQMEQSLQDVLNKGKNKRIFEIMSTLVESTTTKKVKLIGDSITQGVGGTGYAQTGEIIMNDGTTTWRVNENGHCWANSLKTYLQSKYNCVVNNYGASGIDSSKLRDYVLNETLVKSDDDIVICMIGTNDRFRTRADFHWLSDNIKAIHAKVKALGKEVIFMSNIPATVADETNKPNHMEDVDHYIMKATADLGIEYISVYKLFIEYCQNRNITINSLLSDGLHPNDAGYDVMFYLICNALGFGVKRDGATW
jgi:lysophospholipase L1-like esterase